MLIVRGLVPFLFELNKHIRRFYCVFGYQTFSYMLELQYCSIICLVFSVSFGEMICRPLD